MGEVAPHGAAGEPDRPPVGSMAEREQAAGLWPIKRSLTVASITALVGLVVVMTAVLAVLGFPHLQREPLTTSRLLDVLKLVLGTVAGVGALFALVMAYRRQRLAEVADDRDHQRALLDAQRAVLEQERALLEQRRAQEDRTRVFYERFGAASAQLGHEEPAVRLAGAYAMAGLADDWEQGRQTCIDVLCAVLRLPYRTDPGEEPAEDQDPAEHDAECAAHRAGREVRHTIVRIIGNHLNSHTDVSWRGHDLDFTGAVLDGGDLHEAVFTDNATVSFQGARFAGGTFTFAGAQFGGGAVDFRGARFEAGTVTFAGAQFGGSAVDFRRARFEAGTVTFRSAHFVSGAVAFRFARFVGSTVDFAGARFEGGAVAFGRARFESGRIAFRSARIIGGTVAFAGARFVGGTVTFTNVRFEGGAVAFNRARFTDGIIDFDRARFVGATVAFRSARFIGGAVVFRRARFRSGTVTFTDARFEGCKVTFRSATGQRPDGLPDGRAPRLS